MILVGGANFANSQMVSLNHPSPNAKNLVVYRAPLFTLSSPFGRFDCGIVTTALLRSRETKMGVGWIVYVTDTEYCTGIRTCLRTHQPKEHE
jgi:hypothetical protein